MAWDVGYSRAILAVAFLGFGSAYGGGPEGVEILVPGPAKIFSVSCGIYESFGEASGVANQIGALGYGPVWQRETDAGVEILVGKFEYEADAIWVRADLREEGFSVAERRVVAELTEEEARDDWRMPGGSVLLSEGAIYPATVSAEEFADSAELLGFEAVLLDGDYANAATTGLMALELMSDVDPAKGRLAVDVGWCLVRSSGEARASLPFFEKVAKGEIAATEGDQLRARWLYADSLHYYIFNPVHARRAYMEILEEHGADGDIRARAKVEVAACLLELARSEASSFEEVRRACLDLRATISGEFDRAHAVAELLIAETYFYEGDYARAVSAFERVRQHYPARIRERAMAEMFLAQIAGNEGNWELCKFYYESVASTDFSDPEENFYWRGERWNLRERAAKKLVFQARQRGDMETVKAYETYLQNEEHLRGIPGDDGGSFDNHFPHGFYARALH